MTFEDRMGNTEGQQTQPERIASDDHDRAVRFAAGAATALTAVGVLGKLLVRGTSYHGYAFPLLMLASAGYMLVVVVGGGLRWRYGRCIVVALALCFVGDYLGPGSFMTGLAAFLLAHFGFMAAFCVRGLTARRCLRALMIALVVGGAIVWWIYPHVPASDRPPIYAYMAVITAMMVLAGGSRGGQGWLLIVLAASTFYVSDVFLARSKYVSPGSINFVIGFPLYYTACILFAYGASVRGADRATVDPSNEAHLERSSHAERSEPT